MPKQRIKSSSVADPARPEVEFPPPTTRSPNQSIDITAPPENPELAIAMHFAETANDRSTTELLWALPHLKGAMPHSGRECDLVSAEIARRQKTSTKSRGTKNKEVIPSHTADPCRHQDRR
jgi:hypothetical protein